MDVDQDPLEQGTPPSTPFDEDFTPSTTRGQILADPTRRVHTENYFTPLNTESQTTDYTNINTNHKSPTPMRNRNEAIRDAKLAVAAEAAAANQQPPPPHDV
jgi:hypothetical protein